MSVPGLTATSRNKNPDWSVIDSILTLLQMQTNHDYSGNRLSMVSRRIHKRMILTGISEMAEYYHFLENNGLEAKKLKSSMNIKVTCFFRNPFVFHYLDQFFIKKFFNGNKQKSLRIWSAGCATGEEIYSVVILLMEVLKKKNVNISPLIIATDTDREALEAASDGIYPAKKLDNVPFKYINEYFRMENGNYHLRKDIREMVVFSFHDLTDPLLSFPVKSRFGCFAPVLCLNCFTYVKLAF